MIISDHTTPTTHTSQTHALGITSILIVAVRPAHRDGVLVGSIRVPNIGSVRSIPRASVQSADLTLRSTVLGKDIGVDKAARGSAVEVLGIVLGLGLACVNAALRAVDAIIPLLLRDVGVARCIRGGVDGFVGQVHSIVAWDGVADWWFGVWSWSWARSWVGWRLSWSWVGWRSRIAFGISWRGRSGSSQGGDCQ